jgi:hypothetical protein
MVFRMIWSRIVIWAWTIDISVMARKNPVAETERKVGLRLLAVRRRTGLPQTRFAMALSIGRERLVSYETGRVPLPLHVGQIVCDTFVTNPIWLASGKGCKTERYSLSIPPSTIMGRWSFREMMLALIREGQCNRSSPNRFLVSLPSAASPAASLAATQGLYHDEITEPREYFSRSVMRVCVDSLERNAIVRRSCLVRKGPICEGCDRNFAEILGEKALKFLEIHRAESLRKGASDDAENAILLCPNCHRLIHLRVPALTLEELRAFRKENPLH